MASLNVLVKLLSSSPFHLPPFFFIDVAASAFLPPVFVSIFLNFLGYARGKNLVLQPRFCRLPRVRHSVRSHTFSRSLFLVLFAFCLQYFLSYILCFGCICFQFFPCYYFSAATPWISVLQGSLIPCRPCRITGGKDCYPSSHVFYDPTTRWQPERLTNNRFRRQNNNFTRASHFFVHFSAVFARVRREIA